MAWRLHLLRTSDSLRGHALVRVNGRNSTDSRNVGQAILFSAGHALYATRQVPLGSLSRRVPNRL